MSAEPRFPVWPALSGQARTLLEVAADPKHLGAAIGFLSILHTWGQNLHLHPHLRCAIPAGGFAPDHTRWIRPRYPFFLPVKVLSRVFRGKFVAGLRRLYRRKKFQFHGGLSGMEEPRRFGAFLRTLFQQDWVVYAKAAFGGPLQVLRYLGRYTHRVAISNHRLLEFDGEHVTFRWRDYAHGNKQRKMTMGATEFLRRFLQHVLPPGFIRIRQYGFLANRARSSGLALARQLLAAIPPRASPTTTAAPSTWRCPRCGREMIIGQHLTAGELATRCPYFDSS